jgi:AraC-like DNA-binding protein
MFFEDENFAARIFMIDRFAWCAGERAVKARPFGALVLRIRGEGAFRFENGASHHSREGDVMYIPHGVGYTVVHSDGEVLAFHFREDATVRNVENFVPHDAASFASVFWEAYHLFRKGTSASRMEAVACFYRILAMLCVRGDENASEHPAFLRAFSALAEQYTDPDLCISAVCCAAGISESAFRRSFCARYGKPPIRFLTELRLREAQRRLMGSNESVEAIALSCGFRDVKYFSRVVKRYFGCTPSQLRAM